MKKSNTSNESFALATCRPGLESDMADELTHRATLLGVKGEVETGDGYALFRPKAREGLRVLFEGVRFGSLMFARQWLCPAWTVNASEQDRVGPAVDLVHRSIASWSSGSMVSEPCVDHGESEAGKKLADLAKSLKGPVLTACKKRKLVWDRGVGPREAPAMHLLLMPDRVFVALARSGNNSPWPMGIPRLRFPPEAPSRSTLKLEEAFLTLLTEVERDKYLNDRKTAVDLGAAPGGWTWQLVSRGVSVTCVDNADMDPTLAANSLVTHLRENAFSWTPRRKVDWMVCDVVEKPSLVAEMVTRWVIEGHARRFLFNLKLPMRKRYQEVTRLLAGIQKECARRGSPVGVRCRQLFHDREEVTVYVFPEMEGIE